jgi:hypothetical protein
MKLVKDKNEEQFPSLAEVVPQPLVDSEKKEDGKVTLFKPKFKSEFIKKLIKRDYYKIHLDEYGASVWKEIDGKNNGEKILENLNEKLEDTSDLERRLYMFLTALKRQGLVEF